MLLQDKVAVIYGAGGSIAGAVARAYAREGARLFLSNRSLPRLEKLHGDLPDAEIAQLDATDPRAVDAYVDGVAKKAGRIDISFNLMGVGDVQQPLMEIAPEDFLQPIANAMRGHFITTRAAARHMIAQKSGVVLAFGGGGPQTYPGLGGFKVALDALESLRRQWAIELGPHGIRILTLKTGGIAEGMPADTPGRADIVKSLEEPSPMKRTATLADVGNVAAFAASDQAQSITDTWINIGVGAMPE